MKTDPGPDERYIVLITEGSHAGRTTNAPSLIDIMPKISIVGDNVEAISFGRV